MNVERGTFESEEAPEERAYWDARIEAAVEKARNDPRFARLFDPINIEDRIARGEADAAAGRVYSHELVGEWLRTWGQPGRKSFHEWLNGRG